MACKIWHIRPLVIDFCPLFVVASFERHRPFIFLKAQPTTQIVCSFCLFPLFRLLGAFALSWLLGLLLSPPFSLGGLLDAVFGRRSKVWKFSSKAIYLRHLWLFKFLRISVLCCANVLPQPCLMNLHIFHPRHGNVLGVRHFFGPLT